MSNHLAQETSPYLQQHAENPVDWHPWGEDALAAAREQGKPILLSIGYSACHWCHVMAHESFEDPEVAAEMNRHFVNIKVDREERPDLDQIYQSAHQMLTQRAGGWPLTMFLMPDGTPFFAGTYFPRTARYGMPGFRDLLPKIAAAFHGQGPEIARQNDALMQALARTVAQQPGEGALTRAPLDAALHEFEQMFDPEHGGLGGAPKFPHPAELDFCLRRHALDASAAAGAIAKLTLTHMAQGGIFDQLGGGFCRYSVDATWSIPHFEKMLYDNAPLLALYCDAWRVTREPLYASIVAQTAGWVMREMQAPEGGYYASLDADSEGEEGRYYVWTREEVQRLLDPADYAVLAPHLGLAGPPNFEGRAWHLRVATPLAEVAGALGLAPDECAARLGRGRAALLAAREQRVRPGRDEKVLTSWNALMVKGMARAGRVFGQPQWVASARRALDFIGTTLWKNGRLLASARDGRAQLNAYLDDHAFLLDALIEFLQTDFRAADLDFAQALGERLLGEFEDRERGGFYFVSHDHERLILRPKAGHDGATPSGNGVAAFALQRLGHLLGEPRYLAAAEGTIRVFQHSFSAHPGGYASLLDALGEALAPPRIVVLRGAPRAAAQWQAHLGMAYRPDTLVVAPPPTAGGLAGALDKPVPPGTDEVTAWVCQGTRCLPPIATVEGLEQALAAPARTG